MGDSATTVLVLTAGRSRRMGSPKAWLRWQGETLLGRAVRVAFCAGAEEAIVCCGSENDSRLVRTTDVRTHLRNSAPALLDRCHLVVGEPSATPIDSIRRALPFVPASHALLLWPVDHPFASVELVREIIENGRAAHIIVPSSGGRRGHPVLFGSRVWPELYGSIADRGARRVVARDAERVYEVRTTDLRVTFDVDTREHAEALGVEIRR